VSAVVSRLCRFNGRSSGSSGSSGTVARLDAARAELRDTALRAGQGNPNALTELIRATSGYVWTVCARLVDRESADDLVQDTYVRAVRSLPTYRGLADPATWLVTIARRVCADEIARRQRARHLDAQVRAERPSTSVEPAVSVELADAIARLSPARREAFLLTVVAGFSYAEAAAVCDCPIGTIRSRVARAREELLNALELNELERPPGAPSGRPSATDECA
jgi:RNA polymerase sigma-70 factor, ECF subfamily